jgi:hypothetical protein
MTLKVHWIDKPRILAFDFSENVTSEDINTFGRIGLDLVIGQPIYIVVDLTHVSAMPRNLVNTALRSSALITFANHRNARAFAFVQPNTATRFMVDTVLRSAQVKIVQSRDAGMTYLRSRLEEDDQPE